MVEELKNEPKSALLKWYEAKIENFSLRNEIFPIFSIQTLKIGGKIVKMS